MTTSATTFGPRPVTEIEETGLLRGPREGWVTVALLVVMLVTVALAIDDANWAGFGPDGGNQTSFLSLAVLMAAVMGLGLAKWRLLPTALAHLIGAGIGTAFLLVAVSGAVSADPSLLGRLRGLSESVGIFYNDLVVLGIRSSETSVFLLTMGTLVWALGQFAAFNVFRRGRAMPAVVGAGLALLINMSVTIRPQYLHLVIFSAAAMLLLVGLLWPAETTLGSAEILADAPPGWLGPVLAVVVPMALVALLARRCVRRLGGVTGDVLGACVEVAFTASLVALSLG